MKSSTILRVIRFAIERNRVVEGMRDGASAQVPGRTIGFMGARGGSGATTVALNTAAALARQGKSVAAIELSPYRSGFSYQLRLAPRRDLADLMNLEAEGINAGEVRNRLVESDFGVSLLFAPQNPKDSLKLDAERAAAVLRAAAQVANFVIVDLASAPSPVHQACARICDSFLLIMEREATGLAAGKSLASLLQFWGVERELPCGRPNHQRPFVRLRVSGGSSRGVGFSDSRRDSARCRSGGAIVPAGSPLLVADQDTLAAESLMRLAERLATPVLTEVAC